MGRGSKGAATAVRLWGHSSRKTNLSLRGRHRPCPQGPQSKVRTCPWRQSPPPLLSQSGGKAACSPWTSAGKLGVEGSENKPSDGQGVQLESDLTLRTRFREGASGQGVDMIKGRSRCPAGNPGR